IRVADRIHERDPDRVLESHQHAGDDRSVSPRTGPRNVQVITTGLHRELGRRVAGYPAAKLTFLAAERAVRQLPIQRLDRPARVTHQPHLSDRSERGRPSLTSVAAMSDQAQKATEFLSLHRPGEPLLIPNP